MKYSSSLNSRGSRSTDLPAHRTFRSTRSHIQVAGLQARDATVAAPAQKRLDPRGQLANIERFDEIIVAAGLQTIDPFVDGRERADDQDGRCIALATQSLDDRKSVFAMQHAVDHEHRGPACTRRLERVLHRIRKRDRMAARLEL